MFLIQFQLNDVARQLYGRFDTRNEGFVRMATMKKTASMKSNQLSIEDTVDVPIVYVHWTLRKRRGDIGVWHNVDDQRDSSADWTQIVQYSQQLFSQFDKWVISLLFYRRYAVVFKSIRTTPNIWLDGKCLTEPQYRIDSTSNHRMDGEHRVWNGENSSIYRIISSK